MSARSFIMPKPMKSPSGAFVRTGVALDTPWEITNAIGGTLALGHPYGTSGI
jgi:acetyl-CoA acetyltransferase